VRRSKLYRGGQASAEVGVDAAEVGGGGDGLGGEDGHGGAGEEGELEGVSGDVGGHPLGVVGGAKGVVAEELLGAGDVDAVQGAGAGGG
jgi:hypothetical protein